jgi:hypothetical protein
METDKVNVNTPNEAYERMARHWALCEVLAEGTLAMRDAGQTYLPQYAKESDGRYQIRLNATVLYEKYKNTLHTHSARPFGQQVQLAEDAPEFYFNLLNNIDLTGRTLTVFARERLRDLLLYGKTHILVEYPNTIELQEILGRELTLADEKKMELRPYFVGVNPGAVINWDGERIGGVEQLTRLQVRHRVDAPVEGNRWATEKQEFVVVWTPKEIELHKKTSKLGEDEAWEMQGDPFPNTLGKIPLVTIYANRSGLLECEPPLEGLAHLNAKHWRNQSDQDNIESVARVPMLFFKGFAKEDVSTVEIGPYKVFGNKDPMSDVMVVETNGSAVKVGSDALRQLEHQMDAVGMAPMERKPGNTTATELAIEAGREVSDLEAYVMLLEEGLSQAFGLAGEWGGQSTDAPSVLISEDLGYSVVSGKELEEIREDFKMGAIDRRTYLEERKRRGLYHEGLDIDGVIAASETENTFTELDVEDEEDEFEDVVDETEDEDE